MMDEDVWYRRRSDLVGLELCRSDMSIEARLLVMALCYEEDVQRRGGPAKSVRELAKLCRVRPSTVNRHYSAARRLIDKAEYRWRRGSRTAWLPRSMQGKPQR